MQSQTIIFTQLVRDTMHRPRVCLDQNSTIGEVVQNLIQKDALCALLTDGAGRLSGIVRLKDIIEQVTFQLPADHPVTEIMDQSVQTVHGDEFLYQAMARLRRYGAQEVVVVDEANHPIGLVHLHDAYEIAADYLIDRIDKLASDGDVENLKIVKAAQIDMARDLLKDHIPPHGVQNLLSHINKDICARLVANHTRNMTQEGWGEPPVDFAMIMMGSGGRGESFLNPDQDNGFILDDYPDSDHNRIDHYFRELSKRVCDDLNHVGLEYCKGHVMATNPLWRKTLSQWKSQIHLWGRKRNHVALRLADIFFDFDHVCGVRRLSEELRRSVMEIISKNHFFLQEMYHQQAARGVALGLFDRLLAEKNNDHYRDHLNMKYHAILPLVENVRLLALKQGICETSTRARLQKLYESGHLNEAELDHLGNAHRVFCDHLLRSQIMEFQTEKPLSGFVALAELTKRERDRLVYSLKQVENLRKKLKADLTANVF